MAEPRSKRACTVRAQGPSSTHYVGYVEDDETPEAIMKKFEALERVQQRLAQGGPRSQLGPCESVLWRGRPTIHQKATGVERAGKYGAQQQRGTKRGTERGGGGGDRGRRVQKLRF